MLQMLGVTLIVGIALAYTSWYAMPARWRQALARRLAPRAPGLAATLARPPACGACERCGSCEDPGTPAAQDRAPVPTHVVSGPRPRERATPARADPDQDRA